MRKNNVISLVEKLEKWNEAYLSPDDQLYISASNHGRVSFAIGDKSVTLEFVESVKMLTEISKGIETAMKMMKF